MTHDQLPNIMTDGAQLAQVFQNLIGNAIKYHGAEVPSVHVSAMKNGANEWIFSVRDNGMGIDPQYFYHCSTPRHRYYATCRFSANTQVPAKCAIWR